jgi:protease-4
MKSLSSFLKIYLKDILMSQTSSSNWLRNIFLLLLIVQFAPVVIKNVKQYYEDAVTPKTKVGIITIKGPISDTSVYVQQFKTFCEETSIKAILLKVDSPGGFAGASASLHHVIRALKELHHKPVIAWIQNMCASGGYYIVAAADYIIATPVSGIGSIGAYIPQLQLKELAEQYHVKYNAIHAGKYKTTGNPLLVNTPEQNAMLQQFVDDTYRIFVQDMIESRPQLATATKEAWADGKVFTGQRALELHLIDAVGSQLTVEQIIKERAHITTEIAWVRPPKQSHWLKLLAGTEDDGDADHSYIAAAAETFINHLSTQRIQTTL